MLIRQGELLGWEVGPWRAQLDALRAMVDGQPNGRLLVGNSSRTSIQEY